MRGSGGRGLDGGGRVRGPAGPGHEGRERPGGPASTGAASLFALRACWQVFRFVEGPRDGRRHDRHTKKFAVGTDRGRKKYARSSKKRSGKSPGGFPALWAQKLGPGAKLLRFAGGSAPEAEAER